jgi:hypothetical protein
VLGSVEKPNERSKLLVPADKWSGRSGHMAILSQVERRFNPSTFGQRRAGKGLIQNPTAQGGYL